MRKIKKISAQSVEKKETVRAWVGEQKKRRLEEISWKSGWRFTTGSGSHRESRAPQPRNGMLVKTAALHIGIDYTRLRRRDREREKEGGRKGEGKTWVANKLLQVQLENMWRPLINIINNKYLDTPECSQSVSRAGRAGRAGRPAQGTRHSNIFANETPLRRWRRFPLCARSQPTR